MEALSRARRSISEETLHQYELFRSRMKTDKYSGVNDEFDIPEADDNQQDNGGDEGIEKGAQDASNDE